MQNYSQLIVELVENHYQAQVNLRKSSLKKIMRLLIYLLSILIYISVLIFGQGVAQYSLIELAHHVMCDINSPSVIFGFVYGMIILFFLTLALIDREHLPERRRKRAYRLMAKSNYDQTSLIREINVIFQI